MYLNGAGVALLITITPLLVANAAPLDDNSLERRDAAGNAGSVGTVASQFMARRDVEDNYNSEPQSALEPRMNRIMDQLEKLDDKIKDLQHMRNNKKEEKAKNQDFDSRVSDLQTLIPQIQASDPDHQKALDQAEKDWNQLHSEATEYVPKIDDKKVNKAQGKIQDLLNKKKEQLKQGGQGSSSGGGQGSSSGGGR